MLRPELCTFEIGPELAGQLRPRVMAALWQEVGRAQVKSLSIARAKELLALAQPAFGELLQLQAEVLGPTAPLPVKTIGVLLQEAVAESARFFRREGAHVIRDVQKLAARSERMTRLWHALFDRRLRRWLRERGHLEQPELLESIDIVVEAVRLWVDDLAERVGPWNKISPAAYFLDTEAELDVTLEFSGQELKIRGRLDALIVDSRHQPPQMVDYQLGVRSLLDLQVAQTILHLAVVNVARGTRLENACIQFFRLVGDTPPDLTEAGASGSGAPLDYNHASAPSRNIPPAVDAAFAGYVGNRAAVRRVKIACAMAAGASVGTQPINLMLCGPRGLGKLELARRVARALDLQLIDLPADGIRSMDGLLEPIQVMLETNGIEPETVGRDAGLPHRRYPPLLVFLHDIHKLKRPEQFFELFEPNERRAVSTREVGDLAATTFIGATSDKALLPASLRSRFIMVDLDPYSAAEVAEIIAPEFQPSAVDSAFLLALAEISRRNPGVALERARELRAQQAPDAAALTADGVRHFAAATWHVDAHGLNDCDRQYLRALRTGRRGFSSLCQLVPAGADEIRSVIEPYLLQLGLINITPQGRELTELGRRRLVV